jgi:hypothetical protein
MTKSRIEDEMYSERVISASDYGHFEGCILSIESRYIRRLARAAGEFVSSRTSS